MKVETLACPPLPAGRPNLVLAGFMGVGKTSVGRRAALHLGMPFFDLDEELERRIGTSIPELFRSLGESGFRRLEEHVLADAARLSGAVLAVGGGAVLHEEAFSALRQGSVAVVLSCAPAELERRLGPLGGNRPLLGHGHQRLGPLLAERAAAYSAAGHPIDTTGETVEGVALKAVARYRRVGGEMPRGIDAGSGRVVVESGAAGRLGELVAAALPRSERALVVSDQALSESHGSACAAALRRAGIKVSELVVPPGEGAKQLGALAALWRRMARLGADRQDVVVAVGGGATLDMVGMAAATFSRGMPLVNVPTTLLAMADASIGGKVAIDLGRRKNAVGTFHPARLVVCDPDLLASLDPAVRRHGLAEILKSALLGSPLTLSLFSSPEADPYRTTFLVEQAVRVKLAYVAADPEDQGPRLALNLGHTFAHAIESASGFAVSHGEAVAMGLVASARLGARLELSPPGLVEQLRGWVQAAGLESEPPRNLSRARVRTAFLADKKRRSGRQRLLVPLGAGQGAQLVYDLEPHLPQEALFAGG